MACQHGLPGKRLLSLVFGLTPPSPPPCPWPPPPPQTLCTRGTAAGRSTTRCTSHVTPASRWALREVAWVRCWRCAGRSRLCAVHCAGAVRVGAGQGRGATGGHARVPSWRPSSCPPLPPPTSQLRLFVCNNDDTVKVRRALLAVQEPAGSSEAGLQCRLPVRRESLNGGCTTASAPALPCFTLVVPQLLAQPLPHHNPCLLRMQCRVDQGPTPAHQHVMPRPSVHTGVRAGQRRSGHHAALPRRRQLRGAVALRQVGLQGAQGRRAGQAHCRQRYGEAWRVGDRAPSDLCWLPRSTSLAAQHILSPPVTPSPSLLLAPPRPRRHLVCVGDNRHTYLFAATPVCYRQAAVYTEACDAGMCCAWSASGEEVVGPPGKPGACAPLLPAAACAHPSRPCFHRPCWLGVSTSLHGVPFADLGGRAFASVPSVPATFWGGAFAATFCAAAASDVQ